jgi:predicted DsbA family dithiol-disulfide isomerase
VSKTAPTTRRRAFLAFGLAAVAGWVYGAPRIAQMWPKRLVYRDLNGLAPFRELVGKGGISSPNAILTGLEKPNILDEDNAARIAGVRANPCLALFGQTRDPRIPVAIFSDFNCSNCRILEANLSDFQTANPDALRIVRFELPLLGAASSTASKAVLAADRQGGYSAMHDRLRRNRMVTDLSLVQTIARGIGLDDVKLLADMRRPDINFALDQSKAIAAVFGFYGTPGAVIGRTAFLGALSYAHLSQIIEAERRLAPLPCQQA